MKICFQKNISKFLRNMIKINLFTFFIIFLNCIIVNSQYFRVPLWSKTFVNDTTEKFITNNNRNYYIGVKHPTIDIYLPERRKSSGICIIICPGGGYSRIAYTHEGSEVASEFVKNGIAAVVLKYRLPELADSMRHLLPILDAFEAIRVVRQNAELWGINKNKIGIMGFSAGGHIASSTSVHFNDTIFYNIFKDSINIKPDFQILIYPVITFSKDFMHRGSKNTLLGNKSSNDYLSRFFSSEENVKKSTPPAFIVHAADDKGVPVENSLVYFKALKEKNIPVEMHIYPAGGHGFGLGKNDKHLNKWFDDCLKWIYYFFQ